MARVEGTELTGGLPGLRDRDLGLLDGQLVGPPLLGAGERFEQGQRGLEPVPGRGLLREVGLGDRLIELDDRLALLHGVALGDQQLMNVTLDGGCQGGDVVGECLATPQPLDDSRRPVELRRHDPDRDGGFRLLFCGVVRGRIAVRAAAEASRQQDERQMPPPPSHDEQPHTSLLGRADSTPGCDRVGPDRLPCEFG